MSSDPDIFDALTIHRPYYPITQFSFDIAAEAMEHMDYLERTRIDVFARKKFLVDNLKNLPQIHCIRSDTGIMMLKHRNHTALSLIDHLEKSGIFVAKIDGDSDLSDSYVRITLGTEAELSFLVQSLSLM